MKRFSFYDPTKSNMTDSVAAKVAHKALQRQRMPLRVAARWVNAAGYVIGPGGLKKPETSITLQKGAMYGMGASSSPDTVILTSVGEDQVKYLLYPFDGSPHSIQTWIAKDLLTRGTQQYLKTYGTHMDKKTKASMESLLQGGKGRTEKMSDWKRVVIHAVATDPDKDEWYTAEQYGNVGGRDGEDGRTTYEIEAFQSEVAKVKKDPRLEVIKVVDR